MTQNVGCTGHDNCTQDYLLSRKQPEI